MKKEKILVVEDENIVALDIQHGLKRLGYDVPKIVSNGDDAIKAANEIKPDLILMDIQIKGNIDGIQTANEIWNQQKIPVIFLTAYADEKTLHRAKLAEPYGYILKPFEESELHTAIEVALKKHRSVQEREQHQQDALDESEALFKLLVESIQDYAILMLDNKGYIQTWNSGAERIKGYHAEEILGEHFSVFYTEEEIKRGLPQHILKEALSHGSVDEEGWRLKKGGKKIWANVTITALYDKNRNLKGFAKITRDMTDRKKSEIEREKLLQEVQNALKAREDFMSIASHELKTPLTSLLLHTQIMERKFTKTDQIERDEAEKFISLFKRQAVRLDRLVNDMLDVSRIHRGKFELKCDVYEMYEFLEKVIESFKESFEEHGQTINFSGDCPIYVNFDEIRMEQVIGNILTNALKYAPESPVTIELKKSSTHIRTEIKDNGPGIEKSKLDKIFTRFERASSPSEVSGLGLGLYISKEIIKAHKGKIWAESGPGKGATFIIELPLSR